MKKTAIAIVKKLDDGQIDDLICYLTTTHTEVAIPEVMAQHKKAIKALNRANKEPEEKLDKREPLNPDNSDNEDEKSWLTSDDDNRVMNDTE